MLFVVLPLCHRMIWILGNIVGHGLVKKGLVSFVGKLLLYILLGEQRHNLWGYQSTVEHDGCLAPAAYEFAYIQVPTKARCLIGALPPHACAFKHTKSKPTASSR